MKLSHKDIDVEFTQTEKEKALDLLAVLQDLADGLADADPYKDNVVPVLQFNDGDDINFTVEDLDLISLLLNYVGSACECKITTAEVQSEG